ncbi:MAG TPA: alpha-ketoglutarate-dependent dioxygenase AlkB [Pilimelia sp.]|nr:alpha-ketoglutarate-dependent dioxygenase AlkB [Pilimelia sp.]
MPPRPRPTVARPTGLTYVTDLVTPAEERDLLATLTGLDYAAVVLRGQPARRRVRHFGHGYDFGTGALTPAAPLPPDLAVLRRRCAQLAGLAPEAFSEALVTWYPSGAGIGWHRDAPVFGAPVAGVSLGAGCTMRLRRTNAGPAEVYGLLLAPRSAYLLDGAARWAWQHHIPPVAHDRYSVTFRTTRAAPRTAPRR